MILPDKYCVNINNAYQIMPTKGYFFKNINLYGRFMPRSFQHPIVSHLCWVIRISD